MLAHSIGELGARLGVVEMSHAERAAEVALQFDAEEEIGG